MFILVCGLTCRGVVGVAVLAQCIVKSSQVDSSWTYFQSLIEGKSSIHCVPESRVTNLSLSTWSKRQLSGPAVQVQHFMAATAMAMVIVLLCRRKKLKDQPRSLRSRRFFCEWIEISIHIWRCSKSQATLMWLYKYMWSSVIQGWMQLVTWKRLCHWGNLACAISKMHLLQNWRRRLLSGDCKRSKLTSQIIQSQMQVLSYCKWRKPKHGGPALLGLVLQIAQLFLFQNRIETLVWMMMMMLVQSYWKLAWYLNPNRTHVISISRPRARSRCRWGF